MQICNMMNVAADDFFTFQVRNHQSFTVFAFTEFMCASIGLQPPRRGPTGTTRMNYLVAIYVCMLETSDFLLL